MASNNQNVDRSVGEIRRFSWIRQSEAAENDADQPYTSNAKIPMTAAQRQRKHRLKMKNQAVQEISAAKSPPRSVAERQRKYRQRRQSSEQSSSTVKGISAAKPPPQSGAERQRKYRQRRRASEQSSTVAVLNISQTVIVPENNQK